ncbi:unnamed protein product, partial [Pylaiella littoralis]
FTRSSVLLSARSQVVPRGDASPDVILPPRAEARPAQALLTLKTKPTLISLEQQREMACLLEGEILTVMMS